MFLKTNKLDSNLHEFCIKWENNGTAQQQQRCLKHIELQFWLKLHIISCLKQICVCLP